MKRDTPTREGLAEPDQALRVYLQSLLDEIPPLASARPQPLRSAPAPSTPPPSRPPIRLAPPIPGFLLPSVIAVAPIPPPVAVPAAAPLIPPPAPVVVIPEPTVLSVPTPDPAEAPAEEALPEWAAKPFSALQFQVAGQQVAVPLVCLTRIEPLQGGLTQLPGLPPWYLGMRLVRGHKVGVIDLPHWLAPNHVATEDSLPGGGYLLILDGGDWGVTCDALGTVVRVDPNTVRWRRTPGQTPLVRGVLPDTLTPLLSVTDLLGRLAGTRRRD